jgi:ATP-binding cassette subfamily B (MDR/TAP) protein 1
MGDLLDVLVAADNEIQGKVLNFAQRFFIIAGVACALNLCKFFFLNVASDRIANKIRSSLFNSITKQEIGFFDVRRT